jgi:hypothetical protein
MQRGNVCFTAPTTGESEAKTPSASIGLGYLGVDPVDSMGPYCTLSASNYGLLARDKAKAAAPDVLVQAMGYHELIISEGVLADVRRHAMSKFGELYGRYLASMDEENEYLGAMHVLEYLNAKQDLALSSLVTDVDDLRNILNARKNGL